MSDVISRQEAIDYFVTNVGFHDEDGYPIEDEEELREIWTGYFDGIPSAQPEQRTEALKAEIRRMKRSFTTCINSDYYTGYMSALSAVEGYIAHLEGKE